MSNEYSATFDQINVSIALNPSELIHK